ncbi:MAG: CorA family divalent cation transporter [Candidatus Paceibacterota bacterium]|jgi:magnesium transporter
MTYTHTYKGIVWLDLESPTDNEVSQLVKRYTLHPLVGEELKITSSLAKIDFYEDYILVVLTLPARTRKDKGYKISDREITFVIGKTFLITSRTETIEQLEYFSKIFETNSILNNKEENVEHAGHLFHYMVKRIYAGLIEDLENIKDSIITAETRIFSGDEHKMVEVLSNLGRELIDIKQTARMHHDIWEKMVSYGDKSLFGKDFGVYIRDIRDEFNIINELITNTRELLAELRETNDSLLNTKQNETIKMLTMITVICYPATLIASIFTIPALGIPILAHSQSWTILMILSTCITIIFWYFLKKKRWI